MKTKVFRVLMVASVGAAACINCGAAAANGDKPQTGQNSPDKNAAPLPSTSQSKAETPAVLIDNKRVESVLGKEIRSASGEALGNVTDILVDGDGSVRAAIVDFGGFLGVGVRKIAVAWSAIHFVQDKDKTAITAVLDMSKDQLRVAPEYHAGEPIVIVGAEQKQAPPSKPGKS
jgi:sporulation protein YlmC with PRC-barrel domain